MVRKLYIIAAASEMPGGSDYLLKRRKTNVPITTATTRNQKRKLVAIWLNVANDTTDI